MRNYSVNHYKVIMKAEILMTLICYQMWPEATSSAHRQDLMIHKIN